MSLLLGSGRDGGERGDDDDDDGPAPPSTVGTDVTDGGESGGAGTPSDGTPRCPRTLLPVLPSFPRGDAAGGVLLAGRTEAPRKASAATGTRPATKRRATATKRTAVFAMPPPPTPEASRRIGRPDRPETS